MAAWRERKARALDVQPRMVLPDLALLSIAHSPPATIAALRETRGIDARHLRGDAEEEIMAAVAKGRALPPGELRLAQGEQMSKELRPAVALASAWVAQLSRDEEVDAALLATRTDVVEFLSGKPGRTPRARAGEPGWSECHCAGWPAVKRRWRSTGTAGCCWKSAFAGRTAVTGVTRPTVRLERGLAASSVARAPVVLAWRAKVDRQGEDAVLRASLWRHRSWRSPCSRSGPGP